MKKPYCCADSRRLYEQYYDQQQKGYGDFPVYVGAYRQRGHGVGNIFANFMRRIVPLLKTYGPHVLRAGTDIVDDMSKGKSFKDAAMQRFPETISNIVFAKNPQSGSGLRRRRTCRTKKTKRVKRDIFS